MADRDLLGVAFRRNGVIGRGPRIADVAYRIARVVVVLAPSVIIAVVFLQAFGRPESPQRPFTDAWTYIAAGDRLNLGHDLYRLQAGDMRVDLYPELFPVPMVGPPIMGVIARPLAAIDVGLAIWVVACWSALLGTMAYLVDRVGLPAVIVCLALSLSVGEQLAAGNVASFFPLLLLIAWRGRTGALAGVSVGVMAAAKLAPVAMAGWLIGARNWRALAAVAVTLTVAGLACLLFAGVGNTLDYLRVLSTVGPSTFSVSTAIGVSWASYAVLVGGSLLAIGTARWPRISFIVGVLAMTFGTPALYWSGFVALLGVLVPLTDSPAFARYRMLPARSPS